MPDARSLKQVISEGFDFKAFNSKKLAELTGIPERYVEALRHGHLSVLPALPYVKGYLRKVARVLDLDQEELWQLYLKETTPKSSGATDYLPTNRFRVEAVNKKFIIVIAVIAALVVYLFWNIGIILQGPKIAITFPLNETVLTEKERVVLEGEADPESKLTINGQEVYVDKSGRFTKEYQLQPGLNAIEFSAKKFLGRETKITRQIIYQPGVISPSLFSPSNEQGPENQTE